MEEALDTPSLCWCERLVELVDKNFCYQPKKREFGYFSSEGLKLRAQCLHRGISDDINPIDSKLFKLWDQIHLLWHLEEQPRGLSATTASARAASAVDIFEEALDGERCEREITSEAEAEDARSRKLETRTGDSGETLRQRKRASTCEAPAQSSTERRKDHEASARKHPVAKSLMHRCDDDEAYQSSTMAPANGEREKSDNTKSKGTVHMGSGGKQEFRGAGLCAAGERRIRFPSVVSREENRRQVKVDVDRSVAYFDCHQTISDLSRKAIRAKLEKVLENVLEATVPCSDTASSTPAIASQQRQPTNSSHSSAESSSSHREDQPATVFKGQQKRRPVTQGQNDELRRDGIDNNKQESEGHNDPVQKEGVTLQAKQKEGSADGREDCLLVELRYLQGQHELCLVLLEVAELADPKPSLESVSVLARRVISQRVFSMHSSLCLSVALQQVLFQISFVLRECSPSTLRKLLETHHQNKNLPKGWLGDGSELHFLIPWIVTLLSHSITKFRTLTRVWNILFAYPPPFLVYWLAAVVETQYGRLGTMSDFNPLKAGKTLDDLDLIECHNIAHRWCSVVTPIDLALECNQYLTEELCIGGAIFADAQETLNCSLPSLSILPPLWTSILGHRAMAEFVDDFSRVLSGAVNFFWEQKVARLGREWRCVTRRS